MGDRIVRALAAGLLAAAVLPCGGPAAAQGVKLKIGSGLSPISLDLIPPYVALERGLYRKYGLDVQIVEFRGSPTNMKALLAGEIDVALNMGGTDAIVGACKGAKVRMWVVTQPVTSYHFVARKAAGTALRALVGRNVAVGSPADRFKAIVAGKVDATVATNTEAAKLDQHPEIASLAQVPKILSEILYEVGVAKGE